MSENILRIAKGETLCTYELTRLSPFQHGPLPAGVPDTGEVVDLKFTVHPNLRRWLADEAERCKARGYAADTLMDLAHDLPADLPQYIEALDGQSLTAWNLNYSDTVPRNDPPSLRFTQPWDSHLGFLRLTVSSLTRHLRIRMNQPNRSSLWLPAETDRREPIPIVEEMLQRAFRYLKRTHVQWPKTSTTTIQLEDFS